MLKLKLLLGLLLIALGSVRLQAQAPESRSEDERPNVILIFADDLGPGMLGCYGQSVIETPNIDRLAQEGMKFTNYYGNVYCAPARWTLLTGMHDGRIGGWKQSRPGLPIHRDSGAITEEVYQDRLAELKSKAHPIAEGEVFLAQVAQQAGYKTAQFGKLDRGFLTWHERVKRFGWDFYEGYFDHQRCHGFYPPYLWRNGEQFELPQLPHGPVAIPELHPDFANHPTMSLAEKKYASMVKMLDDHVGLILDELKEHGDIFDGAGGRAGLKRSAYQGGMQCPLIVRWPGKIAGGSETALLSSHYDFLSTLAEIVNVEAPAGKDGISYLPTLLGKPQNSLHEFVFINNNFAAMGTRALITQEGFKLVEANRKEGLFQLYNVHDDNEERVDLAAKYPEKVQQLKQIMKQETNSSRPDLLEQ